MRARVLTLASLIAAAVLLVPVPANADARVSIRNDQGTSKVDPKYATTLSLSGSGFQSIKGGHGGIYVFFGIKVGGGYLYVPDSETKNNQGFQKFVAFPGSDTASSANGGAIKVNGTWSTKLVVPGATFKAVNRSGKAQTVDCLKSRCGIITIGAHGVKNARNETFTPVSFADLYGGKAPTGTAPGTGALPTAEQGAEAAVPVVSGKPKLTVDQATAAPGRVMTFNATGLNPGDQVVASLDDGLAAVGPLSVGPNGQVAGALTIPADTSAGTHQLKLTGSKDVPVLNFPVASEPVAAKEETDWLPIGFAAGAGVLLLAALVFSALRIRSIRRKVLPHAA